MRDKLQATREGRITIAVVNKGIEYCVVARLGQLGHGHGVRTLPRDDAARAVGARSEARLEPSAGNR